MTTQRPTCDSSPDTGQFLEFLARDIAAHPQRLVPLNVNLIAQIQTLVGRHQLDLNEPLSMDCQEF